MTLIPGLVNDLSRGGILVGMACSTTLATAGIPKGTSIVTLQAHTFSTAVSCGVLLNPFVSVLKTQDAGASFTDYSDAAQDNDATTDVTLSSQNTLANGDALYLGTGVPVLGYSVDVDATNDTASVMLVEYWNGSDWADSSETDGTDNSGDTLKQDGAITFAMPSDWTSVRLDKVTADGGAVASGVRHAAFNQRQYWTRVTFSATLDSSTTQNSWHAVNKSTHDYPLADITTTPLALPVYRGINGVGSVQGITNAGTASLTIGAITGSGHFA